MKKYFMILVAIMSIATMSYSCSSDDDGGSPPVVNPGPDPEPDPDVDFPAPENRLPASDNNNTAWKINEDVSDEFEGSVVDENKWLISGTKDAGGTPDYGDTNFKGRRPGQFNPANVRIEDGKMKIQSKWDPDFVFDSGDCIVSSGIVQCYGKYGGEDYPITQGSVISKNTYTYGYMEIMCKAADAAVTSSFWGLANGTELDVFEFVGAPKAGRDNLDKEFLHSIHYWLGDKKDNPNVWGSKTWTQPDYTAHRVAGSFHIYGCEWDANGLKFYVDGKLVRESSKATIEAEKTDAAKQDGVDAWILDQPLNVWVDSEIFPWFGIPEEADLPADYEIEYIRVWQK